MALHSSTFEYLKPTDAQIDTMAKLREAARIYAEVTRCGTAGRPRQDVYPARTPFQRHVGECRRDAPGRRDAAHLILSPDIHTPAHAFAPPG